MPVSLRTIPPPAPILPREIGNLAYFVARLASSERNPIAAI